MRLTLCCLLVFIGLSAFTPALVPLRPSAPASIALHYPGSPATPGSSLFPHPAPQVRPHPANAASMSTEILRLVNQHRRAIGRPPLQANSFISSVALGHSRDMLAGRTPFGHDGFRDRVNRIRKKLGPLHVAAENVASGPMSAREVVDGWLHSPGHRRNIEGDFKLTGIGLAFGHNGNIFFTQIFTK